MKYLIAAACACVIAVTGYYFVGEFRAYQHAESEKAALQEILDAADAEPGDTTEIRTFCVSFQNLLKTDPDLKNTSSENLAKNCRHFGYY